MTGANVNPSVTFSNYLRKENKYKLNTIPYYLIGQLLGAFIGLIMARYINDIHFYPIVPKDY
jgi:glycerol uptake facilitator-like aquaporin